MPGTLQQYIVAHASYITLIPDEIPSEIAAPLLCAGLTMYGAISKLNSLAKGDWVVILGSGGGLGHLGVQLAVRLREYKVVAVDYGQAKGELSLTCGADCYVDLAMGDLLAEEKIKAITGGGGDAVLVVSGSEDAFRMSLKLVRNMGTIVCIGLPPNDFILPISASLCSAKGMVFSPSQLSSSRC